MNGEEIIEILTAHKESLCCFGVDRIGLVNAKMRNFYSLTSEIDLLVDLRRQKNDFSNFMTLVAFLENILDHKINLMLMQPRTRYLSPSILDHTEFISTGETPLSHPSTISLKKHKPSVDKQQNPGVRKNGRTENNHIVSETKPTDYKN